jgi:hypothetical protein
MTLSAVLFALSAALLALAAASARAQAIDRRRRTLAVVPGRKP